MKKSFDIVAPFYGRLSRLVYGRAILRVEAFLANAIPAGSSILIVGGGTGHILEEIAKKHDSGLQITYVDISEKMIAFSKKRNAGNNEVLFINKSIYDVLLNEEFDVVVTPFFFDNFSNNNAQLIFEKINASLKPLGIWLFADFQVNAKSFFWQKLLLKIMYWFFRFFCGIEAADLPDTNSLFEAKKYKQVSVQNFYRRFIYAAVYKKV